MAGQQYTSARIPGTRRDGGPLYRPEFHTWRHMIQRCTMPRMPNFKDYGGRGISVYPEWLGSFDAFLRDVGPRPTQLTSSGKRNVYSLDRIDNDGNYEPGNCRWATWKEQANNTRKQNVPKPERHKKPTVSLFLGVSFNVRGKWLAKVQQRYLGVFRDEFDAATAYNFAALETFGSKALYNTPNGRPLAPTGRYY